MTQGKIERYHRSMKNAVLLQNKYFPSDLEKLLAQFVEYYTNERYHESLENLTPADIYFGKVEEVLTRREEIKRKIFQQRRMQNLQPVHA
jgi:putative transposase